MSEETAREMLVQANSNARAYMDLRFKHFTTYMVTVGFVGAAASRLPAFSVQQGLTCLFGLIVTCLFWRIDYRTGQYLTTEYRRVASYVEYLGVPTPVNVPTTSFGSGMVTSLLFALYADVWFTAALESLFH